MGDLGSLEYHQDTCDHALLSCPNECTDGSTPVQVFRKDLTTHLKERCPNRSYQCPHCGEEGKHCDITTCHLETCPQLVIPCPNNGCNERLPRCDIANHRQTCPLEEVACKYSMIGCEQIPLRKELHDHEKDDQLHLPLAMETILQTTLLQASLSTDESEGERATTTTTFKMANFSQYKQSGEVYYSPPFYTTHQGGCKMCLKMRANGCQDAEDTHISVYASLMRGENDDNLTWPFTGSVTVELLNQVADKEHLKQTITFDRGYDGEHNRRVVDSEIAPCGWGRHRFIPHADLGHDPVTDRQLLKDDCLYFRVSAKATPNPRPWLTCNM